jgi:hypothetical protein
MKNKIFDTKPTKFQILWYHLTKYRFITKQEFLNLQRNLVIILEGIREGELQHFQTERNLEHEIKILKQGGTLESKTKEQKNNDEMFG